MPPGPIKRFDPGVLVRNPLGDSGSSVGVAGREVGVGIELPVVVVLKLAPERRDAGRRIPVFFVLGLRANEPLPKVGEDVVIPRLEDPEWHAVGLVGLETRRLSLWRSLFTGDGESSMTNTQPDVSPLLFPFGSSSLLRRESTLRRMLSRLVFAVVANETDEEEELPKALTGDTAGLARPVILPILSRGTRV